MSTRTKRRSCDGKARYTRKEARAVVRKRGIYGNYTTYKCSFCGHWHVGHKPRPRRTR